MTFDALVFTDQHDSFKGKRGRISYRLVDCIDNSKPLTARLKTSFRFILSDWDVENFPQDLTDRIVQIEVHTIKPIQCGRVEMRGRIVKVLT